jgi:glyoxalase/bleomycin resistance protein/dioxygenase superfamily protein
VHFEQRINVEEGSDTLVRCVRPISRGSLADLQRRGFDQVAIACCDSLSGGHRHQHTAALQAGWRLTQSLGLVSLVVRDYYEALAFFVGKLGFTLVEDTFVPEQGKRWVVVSPPGAAESRLLLARPAQ